MLSDAAPAAVGNGGRPLGSGEGRPLWPNHDDRGFGVLLRHHRHTAGLSQEELAGLSGLSVDAIAALERGRRRVPRPVTVRMLAEALKLQDDARTHFVDASRQQAVATVTPRPRLPVPANNLIGRAPELAEAVALFADSPTRLLTLTGPGGVGKTRLALEIASSLNTRLDAGAHWIALGPVPDGATVPTVVATALGVRISAERSAVDTLVDAIGRREMLIVLDNCEHVLDACAELTSALLQRCPELFVLVTSRELLRVPGEVVRDVPPLSLPTHDSTPEQMARSAAVQLFLARASARGFTPAATLLPGVSQVCARLDGLPLAIELAAARTNVLSIDQLAAKLDSSLGILANGARTVPQRQHTLGGAIDWSYELLRPDERRLFADLSVFSHGCTLEAAEAVACGPDRWDNRGDVLDILSRLADKSMIRLRRDTPEPRYTMLAVIRSYAHDHLAESGRLAEVEERHARYYVDLSEQAEPELRDRSESLWLIRLDAELDNLRAAIAWATRHRRADEALRLAGALWMYCYLRGRYAEGLGWLESALAVAGPTPADDHGSRLRAKALLGSGMLSFLLCRYEPAGQHIEAALGLFRDLGDDAGTALGLQRLGSIAREQGDYARATALHRRSLDHYRRLEDVSGVARQHNHLGFVAWLGTDFAEARRQAEAAQAVFRRTDDGEGIAWSLINLGSAALYGGELLQAETLLQEAHTLSSRMGYREGVGWTLSQLGAVARRSGDLDVAVRRLDESLALQHDLGDRWRSASVLEELARLALMRGDAPYAAFLLGTAEAVRTSIGTPIPACEVADHEYTVAGIKAALGDRAELAWAAGRATPLRDVVEARNLPPETDIPDLR
ncbi:MAG TPA: tetratricopeptide repeat protein [Jiangellaceae bacterium]|nr:tetratricopeptide repeat protein [Jiangellaceae bacterium]